MDGWTPSYLTVCIKGLLSRSSDQKSLVEALRLAGPNLWVHVFESSTETWQRACSSVGYLVHCLKTILRGGHRPEIGENDRMLMVVIVEWQSFHQFDGYDSHCSIHGGMSMMKSTHSIWNLDGVSSCRSLLSMMFVLPYLCTNWDLGSQWPGYGLSELTMKIGWAHQASPYPMTG